MPTNVREVYLNGLYFAQRNIFPCKVYSLKTYTYNCNIFQKIFFAMFIIFSQITKYTQLYWKIQNPPILHCSLVCTNIHVWNNILVHDTIWRHPSFILKWKLGCTFDQIATATVQTQNKRPRDIFQFRTWVLHMRMPLSYWYNCDNNNRF